ncbi:hypothetical protein T02_8354 [Trichinella nativa]|uniref:Uncharacterized protein n=1 Tax=Trichinella nativa TaxID=6335 RepID=A0A0V1KR04_9BILA|nr:hypothetical protein T02_8354 [Trichinella nativa]
MLIKRCFPWRRPLTLLGPQMMLWFLRAIVARAVRNRKGYAVTYDSLVTLISSLSPCNHKSLNYCEYGYLVTRSQRLGDLMLVFMIKIPNPDSSATQFQLRFLEISHPSRPRPDAPDPLYQTGNSTSVFEIDNTGIIEKCEDFKRKSSEEQNWPKSTRTELLNLRQSQFCSIHRIYHELREKQEALQNVKDPKVRTELESEFEEESASTKRHTIGVMRQIGKLFLWKIIILTILCEGLMNRVLYVVTAYCFTWWTCGNVAHASAASLMKFIILKLKISTARNKAVFLSIAKNVMP